MISFHGRHFPKNLILMAVRWKLAYPLSYRNIEELMDERGADADRVGSGRDSSEKDHLLYNFKPPNILD